MEASLGASAASRFTRLSKLISAILGVLCLLTLCAPATRRYLTLVPGRTLPCVWNLLTSSFVTTNPVKALAEIASLLVLARVVEPVYGSTEFLRLLLLVAASTGAATFVGVYLFYLINTSKEGGILYAQFSGFHGIVGALLVAVKQIMGDADVKLGAATRLPARHLAPAYVAAASLLAALLGAWRSLPFLVVSPYAAWVYLRFFQRQPETTIRGDPSDEFKFSSFFPPAVQAPLDAVGGIARTVFCLGHTADAAAANGGASLEARGLLARAPSAPDMDASRRRERGARALEERLAAGKAAGGGGGGAAAADAAARMEAGAA
ncbi:hypothetical protein Rsub_01379 [Raphidocelis subcapitata]|uniref:Transmembrane protein 115 n=1 Tax=Raphidocelis subcapitata TaxID=307507 RepID=A0A2V0NTI6_9CHLO|nr:hypothetical protein Rsub_01379 [Raphidocelis subcapitata]|eukprot:GBF88880.1 hypothetical protein Rsub_01379 [Raphidocelis subcapitata]